MLVISHVFSYPMSVECQFGDHLQGTGVQASIWVEEKRMESPGYELFLSLTWTRIQKVEDNHFFCVFFKKWSWTFSLIAHFFFTVLVLFRKNQTGEDWFLTLDIFATKSWSRTLDTSFCGAELTWLSSWNEFLAMLTSCILFHIPKMPLWVGHVCRWCLFTKFQVKEINLSSTNVTNMLKKHISGCRKSTECSLFVQHRQAPTGFSFSPNPCQVMDLEVEVGALMWRDDRWGETYLFP